jgi:hypothetical protein
MSSSQGVQYRCSCFLLLIRPGLRVLNISFQLVGKNTGQVADSYPPPLIVTHSRPLPMGVLLYRNTKSASGVRRHSCCLGCHCGS